MHERLLSTCASLTVGMFRPEGRSSRASLTLWAGREETSISPLIPDTVIPRDDPTQRTAGRLTGHEAFVCYCPPRGQHF